MWLFDTILLKRIELLEKLNENLIGANSVLEEQLNKSQFREQQLLQKVFELSGVDSKKREVVRETSEPIQVGGRRTNWHVTKQILENKLKEDYWRGKDGQNKVESLEEEVGINTERNKEESGEKHAG